MRDIGNCERAANSLAMITAILYEEEELFLQEIERLGLSTRHLRAIDLIASLGKPTHGEIAALLKKKKPSITALIKELVEKECLRKVRSDVDRREFHMHLTKKASALVVSHEKVHERFAARLLEFLRPAEQSAFAAMLEKIASAMDKKEKEG